MLTFNGEWCGAVYVHIAFKTSRVLRVYGQGGEQERGGTGRWKGGSERGYETNAIRLNKLA